MPDVQKVEALIRIVDLILRSAESSIQRHGSMDERDMLKDARKELDKLKTEK